MKVFSIITIISDIIDKGKSMSLRISQQEKMAENLSKWTEITSLCIELRKSVLKKQHKNLSTDELTNMVFHEIVINKEKKWKLRKSL